MSCFALFLTKGDYPLALFAGAYPDYKMGDKDFYTPRVRSSCFCIRGSIPDNSSSIYAVNVDCWDDVWLWLWVSTNYFSCSCWCITSLLHWTSLLPQNSSMCQPKKKAVSLLDLNHIIIMLERYKIGLENQKSLHT